MDKDQNKFVTELLVWICLWNLNEIRYAVCEIKHAGGCKKWQYLYRLRSFYVRHVKLILKFLAHADLAEGGTFSFDRPWHLKPDVWQHIFWKGNYCMSEVVRAATRRGDALSFQGRTRFRSILLTTYRHVCEKQRREARRFMQPFYVTLIHSFLHMFNLTKSSTDFDVIWYS
jgi:hypothetical protein